MSSPHKVLIVDDEPANLRLLNRVLGPDYEILAAESGLAAEKLLQENTDISLIISDQRMPGMSGVELLQRSLVLAPRAIRILLTGYTDIAALIEAVNTGNIYKYVQKPWDAEDLKLTVRRALETYELKNKNELLVVELRGALDQLEELSMGTIVALANALDAKCDYTSGHSLRVSRYALAIGKQLGLCGEDLKDLELAGILHDIGKIAVPEAILWKPERLDAEEQKIMAIHPLRSEQMIADIKYLKRVRSWVRHHHEHFDGSGYPDGLAGEKIPFGARVVLVADAYDAMTSDRPYRKSIGCRKASEELKRYAGRQFDPELVEALLKSVGENGEFLEAGVVGESYVGLKLNAIDLRPPGKPYLWESEHPIHPESHSGS